MHWPITALWRHCCLSCDPTLVFFHYIHPSNNNNHLLVWIPAYFKENMQCSKHRNHFFFKDCDDAFPQLLTLAAPQMKHYTLSVFPTDSHSICGGLYMQIHSLPAGGDCREVSPVTLYTKQRSAHKCCFIRHYMQDDMKMTSKIFWRQSDSFRKTRDIKTPTPGFDFETCSAHVYSTKSKPFGKSICGGQFWYCGVPPQINQCMGNTDYALCTQPCSVWIRYGYFVIHNLSLIAPHFATYLKVHWSALKHAALFYVLT